MRQRNFQWLAVVGLVLSLLPQAWAEEPIKAAKAEKMIPIVVHVEMIEVSDQTWSKLKSVNAPGPQKVEGKLLQSMDLLISTGEDAYAMLGHKSPITYYDPRATQFQVQYVDLGCKIDAKCTSVGVGRFAVNFRSEFSIMDRVRTYTMGDQTTSYPETTGLILQTKIPSLAWGETVVLGKARGTSTKEHLKKLGRTDPSQNIVVTARLEQP